MPPTLILLHGPTSSGKTTLAHALQETLLPEIWLHFSFDTLFETLPLSVQQHCNTEDDWSGVDGQALFSSAIICLSSLIADGHRVLFDVVLPNEGAASRLREMLVGVELLSVRLACPWEEIEERTRSRGDRSMSEARRSFDQTCAFSDHDLILDTSTMATEEAVDRIRHALQK